jgi:1,4-alpha-glucan branching enzyme
VRLDWKIQVSDKGDWKEIFNSDAKKYWGTGDVFNPDIKTVEIDKKSQVFEINVHLPPLAAIVLK